MRTLKDGNPFTENNVRNIRKIAKIIMWVGPLKYVLHQLEIMVFHRGFRFAPEFHFYDILIYGLSALFIGYAIIVLAEVFNEGNQIKEEQKLTI